MKTRKITAKLRDTVPVCLTVNGEEVIQYKNFGLPDMRKEIEMIDSHFNVHMDEKPHLKFIMVLTPCNYMQQGNEKHSRYATKTIFERYRYKISPTPFLPFQNLENKRSRRSKA